MRNLILLFALCLLVAVSFVPAATATRHDAELRDASQQQIAARFHYRARRGSIFRR